MAAPNLDTFRTKFKDFFEARIQLEYWGVNIPEKYWVDFITPLGVTGMALPVTDIETSPAQFRCRYVYSFVFKFYRDQSYDELPLGQIEHWYYDVTNDLWAARSFCLLDTLATFSFESDSSPITVSVDEGSEDWLVTVNVSFYLALPYSRPIQN